MKQFYSVLKIKNKADTWACFVVCETPNDEKDVRVMAFNRGWIVEERVNGMYREAGIFLNDLPAYEN